jgi:predicted dehydrogenase
MASSRQVMRYAMIGGGEAAFIGAVHRMAAALDGQWTLCAGSFSSDTARNLRSGQALGLAPARIHCSLDALLSDERARPVDERVHAIAIVTPNHLHKPMAVQALDAGFHVLSEKPMALSLAEAIEIEAAVVRSGKCYALAFTYSAYPLVEEARQIVARGDLGAIRLVHVEYPQGWLSTAIELEGQKQAEWRTDPARSGPAGCLGDIGTHAFQLAEHVSGLRIEAVSSDLSTHVRGRRVDDNLGVLLRFEGGARGMLMASQVAAGEENGLRIRVYGLKGGLEWAQQEPNSLTVRWHDRPAMTLRAGGPGLSAETMARLRTPAGHPEGYIEAFANIYVGFANAIRTSVTQGQQFPSVPEGIRSMTFVEAVLANSRGTTKWTRLDEIETAARGGQP